MPWKECHVMDERRRFVARLLEGEKMAPLCAEFRISGFTTPVFHCAAPDLHRACLAEALRSFEAGKEVRLRPVGATARHSFALDHERRMASANTCRGRKEVPHAAA